MKTLLSGACVVLFGAVVSAQSSPSDPSACEQLVRLSLLNTKITLAQQVTTAIVTLPPLRSRLAAQQVRREHLPIYRHFAVSPRR